MARPARCAGRQAQGPGLLLVAALAAAYACANVGDPPGGPPDTAAPTVVSVRPESGAVVPGWKDEAVIQFDEVIDELGGGGATGGAATGAAGLARLVLLSPVAGDVEVRWGRTRIRVKPEAGWKPGRIYRLELLPGVLDLRRNKLATGRVIVFSTGPAIGQATLTGTALLWAEQRALAGALIEAVPLPDSVGYLIVGDSAGRFQLDALRPGRYVVYATADQNNNRRRDRREAYDSALVTLDSSAAVALFTFVHDTAPPRLRTGTAVDSLTARIEFSQALDASRPLDTAAVRVLQLPDSGAVALAAVLTPRQYDSATAAERAAARPDTAAGPPDTTRIPRVDTTEVRRLLAQRPAPFDRVMLRFAQPLAPETRYLVRVRGATNLSGAVGEGQVVFLTPKRAPADTTRRAPRP